MRANRRSMQRPRRRSTTRQSWRQRWMQRSRRLRTTLQSFRRRWMRRQRRLRTSRPKWRHARTCTPRVCEQAAKAPCTNPMNQWKVRKSDQLEAALDAKAKEAESHIAELQVGLDAKTKEAEELQAEVEKWCPGRSGVLHAARLRTSSKK